MNRTQYKNLRSKRSKRIAEGVDVAIAGVWEVVVGEERKVDIVVRERSCDFALSASAVGASAAVAGDAAAAAAATVEPTTVGDIRVLVRRMSSLYF